MPEIRSSAPSLWSAGTLTVSGVRTNGLSIACGRINRSSSHPKSLGACSTSRPLKTGRGRDLGHVFHHFYLVFHGSQKCYLEEIWRSLEWSNSAARAVRGPRINKMRLRNHKQPCHQIEPVDSHRALRAPPPRKGPSPEDPRQCESVGINSDRRGPWGMIACGNGNE